MAMPIMASIIPLVPRATHGRCMNARDRQKPGYNEFFAYEVIQSLGKEYRKSENEYNIEISTNRYLSIVGSVVECSPATRAARVRFPDDAVKFFFYFHEHKNDGPFALMFLM